MNADPDPQPWWGCLRPSCLTWGRLKISANLLASLSERAFTSYRTGGREMRIEEEETDRREGKGRCCVLECTSHLAVRMI